MCYVDIHGNTRHGPDISVIVCTDHWQAGDSEVFLSLSLLSGFIFLYSEGDHVGLLKDLDLEMAWSCINTGTSR